MGNAVSGCCHSDSGAASDLPSTRNRMMRRNNAGGLADSERESVGNDPTSSTASLGGFSDVLVKPKPKAKKGSAQCQYEIFQVNTNRQEQLLGVGSGQLGQMSLQELAQRISS